MTSIKYFVNATGEKILRNCKEFVLNIVNREFALFLKENKANSLRLNYELDEKSVVFDVGGYEGQWASDIFSKYLCTIHIFEPVSTFADNIQMRFKKNPKIILHKFGLAGATLKTQISMDNDSSSIYKNSMSKREPIYLKKISEFLAENKINRIDLLKINIEGGEYDLLDDLIENDYIKNIQDIQVQFHNSVPNAEKRMLAIHKNLSKTHYLTYQYKFVWENWRKIDCSKENLKEKNCEIYL